MLQLGCLAVLGHVASADVRAEPSDGVASALTTVRGELETALAELGALWNVDQPGRLECASTRVRELQEYAKQLEAARTKARAHRSATFIADAARLAGRAPGILHVTRSEAADCLTQQQDPQTRQAEDTDADAIFETHEPPLLQPILGGGRGQPSVGPLRGP